MAGKSRKKLTNLNSRKWRPPGSYSAGDRGLFVEGGFLSDWAAFNSPPSGRKVNNGGNGNSRSGNVNGRGSNSIAKSWPVQDRRIETNKRKGNAYRYQYPQENAVLDEVENQDNTFDASNPLVLISSGNTPIVAYIDEGPVKESQSVEYIYDYTTNFTLDESSHRGLGFCDEMETTVNGVGSSSKMEEEDSFSVDLSSSEAGDADPEFYHGSNAEIGEDLMDEASPEENPGFLLIGGTKIYTHDISDEDDEGEDEEEPSEDEESGSSVSEDDSATLESDDLSYSGSDIDDALAEDYLAGIGGVCEFVNVEQLVGKNSVMSDDSDSENSIEETLQKLGGIGLQEASREYGMKKPEQGRKNRLEHRKSTPVKYFQSYAIDDLDHVKDIRTLSGKKSHIARALQSWPSETRKSKKHRRLPGEKKKQRKETIAVKRRDRMIRHGVDLQKINLKLQQMVLDGFDMQSFTPMHPRDCSQLWFLSEAIYLIFH